MICKLFLSSLLVLLTLMFGPIPKVRSQKSNAYQVQSRHKNFGSSLKRLKWDEKKRATVEIQDKSSTHRNGDSDDVVHIETSLVVCDVLVLDRSRRSVQGLSLHDFVLTEDGKPQEPSICSVGDSETIPRSIVLIIDCSQLGFVKTSLDAANTLVDKLGPRDRMAIVTDEVKLLVDFTQDKSRLKESLGSLRRSATLRKRLYPFPLSRGAHYSALMATLKELFSENDLCPIIILQAVGNEAALLRQPIGLSVPPNLSDDERAEAQTYITKQQQYLRPQMREFSLDDLYTTAEKSRATIYTVIPAFSLIDLPPKDREERIKDWDERALAEWAKAVPANQGPQQFIRHNHWQRVWIAEGMLEQELAMVELSKLTGGWAEFIEEPSHSLRDRNRFSQTTPEPGPLFRPQYVS